MVARTGTDITALDSRNDVQALFGTPKASGENHDGHFEEYRTHRKIADHLRGMGHGMGFMMSFGLLEPVNLAREVGYLSRTTLLGHDVRFTYDDSGKVIDFWELNPATRLASE